MADDIAEPPLLQVQDLSIAIRLPGRNVLAVEDVSFALRPGRTLGVVGESGSGKSLTARAIMRLLPAAARLASGRIMYGGTDLATLPEAAMRRRRGAGLAMIFQDPLRALDPTMRVGAQIVEAIRTHRAMDRGSARREALALLDAVRIPAAASRLEAYPHQLSGGMRQRVVIAIALAGRPRLLIADEPTTALDVTTQAEILDLLQQLQQELGMAMILITHDMAVASECTDHIAVMYAGRVVELAPTAAIFAAPQMPYTAGLLASVVDVATAPHTRLHAIPGRPPSLGDLPTGCRFHPRCASADAACAAETPALQEATAGHARSCWHPLQNSLSTSWGGEGPGEVRVTSAPT